MGSLRQLQALYDRTGGLTAMNGFIAGLMWSDIPVLIKVPLAAVMAICVFVIFQNLSAASRMIDEMEQPE